MKPKDTAPEDALLGDIPISDACEAHAQQAIGHNETADAHELIMTGSLKSKMGDLALSRNEKAASKAASKAAQIRKLFELKKARRIKKKMAPKMKAKGKDLEVQVGVSDWDHKFLGDWDLRCNISVKDLSSVVTYNEIGSLKALAKEKMVSETPWRHYSSGITILSATDKGFGDRAQPTPPLPFASGSLGYFVVGALYVGFQLLKYMVWV